MKEYDSILKENKKYDNSIENSNFKKFPWFKVDILLISILLIIGYCIYYSTILNPKQIFINDVKTLINKYDNILYPLEINKLKENYGLIGNINFNNKNYNFEIDKINKETNFILGVNSQNINYYSNNGENYLKLYNKETYYKINNNDYFNIISNIKEYFKNLSEDKFIKKFYLNGTIPIVESNLVLNNNDIIEALKPNNYDSTYEVLFTFKNNAITNKIISIKIVINNLMTNEREVLFWENNKLSYKNDEVNLRYELERNDKDFTLKSYKSDILFSTLTGMQKENSYEYSYQVIDKVSNINVNLKKENEFYYFDINYTADNIEDNIVISYQFLDPIIDNDISNSIDYSTLTYEEKEIYNNNLNMIIGDLKEVISRVI